MPNTIRTYITHMVVKEANTKKALSYPNSPMVRNQDTNIIDSVGEAEADSWSRCLDLGIPQSKQL